MPAVAITDHGVMYGAIELINTAKDSGVKPIVGCEIYVIDGDINDRSTRRAYHHLVLLAQNLQGYQNLVKLVTIGQVDGFYYKPRVNWELVKQHSEGLIALTACLAGPVAQPIMRGNPQEARERAKVLKDIFGKRAYLEIQDHGLEGEYRVSMEMTRIAQEVGMELVITNDSHYSRPGDNAMHEILLCMQTGKTLNDTSRMQAYGPEFYIKNGDQMAERFQHLDRELVNRALDNTLVIADQCNLKLPMGQSILPKYPLPPGVSEEDALKKTVYEHAASRYPEITPEIQDRLNFELGIINQMGFPAYFLIVWDFINYARKNDIPVGPGRGSAAGSLVAYSLGITNIDPLEHNLLFERFLNPERVSMPDIDIDFCIERRDEVIQYVRERYGEDQVCQIITFGTLAARAALKGVARVMEIPFSESDKLAKMIPSTPGTKLDDALGNGMELKKLYDSDERIKQLVDLAKSIEGTACNVGTHAAGVVISKDPLSNTVPLQRSKDGQLISQYPMGDMEKLGLLKMDFLGLRNLTIINNSKRLIEQTESISLNMDTLPLDDKAVYQTLASGETDGVFQLESNGMKTLVKDLKPTTFEDINALVALFRPGPLNSGMVKDFVDRKHGRSQVTFKHPDLEPILKDTYGTIVYQEQIMQIAQILAGYSLGQADLLRRAMGKKKADVMAKEKDGFVQGSLSHGVDEALAVELFETMTEFAAYCFNRSHSAAYAMVAYQTAYLKTHHPVAYLSALLSSVRNDLDKTQHYIVTARRMHIQVLPPDVTKSGLDFTPDGPAIRFGLASIKNVGVSVVEHIVRARNEKPFQSLEDFLKRVDSKVLNRKTLESLIRCGALDTLGYSRKQLFHNVEGLVEFAQRSHQQQDTGQVSLFDLAPAPSDQSDNHGFSGLILSGSAEEFSPEQIQRAEKELLGFYLTSHPLDNLVKTLPMMINQTIAELKDMADGTDVLVGGMISSLQRRLTKQNKPMIVGTLEDFSGSVEFVGFSEAVQRFDAITDGGNVLEQGSKIILKGRLQFRGDDSETYSIIIEDLRPIAQIQPLQLSFKSVPRYEQVAYLSKLLAQHRGPHPVILTFEDGTRIKTGSQFWVDDDRTTLSRLLEAEFGPELQIA